MRIAVVLVLLALARDAHADATPIRITIQCEQYGRTKACSAFLVSFIEANKLLISAPRAEADVILYVSANEVANVDRVHMRYVSNMPGTPPVIEFDVDIDTRGTDDEQRAQLEPAFLRGIALYVAARHPSAVTVALVAPEGMDVKKPKTTPYGFSFNLGGSGNYTENYQSYNGYTGFEVTRVTARDKAEIGAFANGGLNRQPPFKDENGTEISLDTSRWQIGTGGGVAWLYNRCWAVGLASNLFRDDDKGQFKYNSTTKLGLEWDLFKPDDARGNKLAVAYFVGYIVERYYVENVDGDSFAQYPTHEIVATGQVRKDKVALGLSLTARDEILHPYIPYVSDGRRYTLSASPSVEVQIGGHVDFSFGFSVAVRELPGPNLDLIPLDDNERRSRLSYADPLQVNGYFNMRIHWDRTNGARNDRFDNL